MSSNEKKYLLKQKGIWFFRMKIPAKYRHIFGVKIYKRTTGEDFWVPETVAGRVAAGIGGFVGFAAPLPISPLRVGSKIATGLAGAGIRMAGKNTVKSATRKAVGEVIEQGGKEATQLFAKQIGKASNSWVQMARWDTKVAQNWEKFASKNIDDLVAMGVKTNKIKIN